MEPLDLSYLATSGAQLVGGWHLIHDARTLHRLGSGRLDMDLRRNNCLHGNRWIPLLQMAGRLRSSLNAALAAAELPAEYLTGISIRLQVNLREQPDIKKVKSAWAGFDGPYMVCSVEVSLVLATAEVSWTGKHIGYLEWPRSWAEKGK